MSSLSVGRVSSVRLSLVFGVAVLVACSRQAAKPLAILPTATTVTAQDGALAKARELGGFIAPLQNVSLSSALTEPASEVYVVEGQPVASGAPLATFDVSDLQAELDSDLHTASEAQLNATKQYYSGAQTISAGTSSVANNETLVVQAREKERLDQINLARDAALLRQQYISQQTYDSQLETVKTDAAATRSNEAALASARITVATNGSQSSGLQGASLQAAHEAALQAVASAHQIRAQIARATLRAPIGGIVTNRNLNPGEYPGSRTLFTIQALDNVYAQLNASSEELAGVRIGNSVTLNAHGTSVHLKGRVVAILGQAAPGSTNFTIKVLVANPARTLLAGMAVDSFIRLSPTRGTVIPRAALSNDETTVGIVLANKYRVVRVRVLAENADRAVVSGVTPGTKVVTGASDLHDGERVAVR